MSHARRDFDFARALPIDYGSSADEGFEGDSGHGQESAAPPVIVCPQHLQEAMDHFTVRGGFKGLLNDHGCHEVRAQRQGEQRHYRIISVHSIADKTGNDEIFPST